MNFSMLWSDCRILDDWYHKQTAPKFSSIFEMGLQRLRVTNEWFFLVNCFLKYNCPMKLNIKVLNSHRLILSWKILEKFFIYIILMFDLDICDDYLQFPFQLRWSACSTSISRSQSRLCQSPNGRLVLGCLIITQSMMMSCAQPMKDNVTL